MTNTTEQSIEDKEIKNCREVFRTNQTIRDTVTKTQLKLEHPLVKQKPDLYRTIYRAKLKKKQRKLIESRPLEKAQIVQEDCFVSRILLAVKKVKSLKVALNSRKLNDSCKN